MQKRGLSNPFQPKDNALCSTSQFDKDSDVTSIMNSPDFPESLDNWSAYFDAAPATLSRIVVRQNIDVTVKACKRSDTTAKR